LNGHGLIDKFQSTFESADEAERKKYLDLLILHYAESHIHTPHQIGFLTGLKTYSTYSIRVEFNPQLKKEYA